MGAMMVQKWLKTLRNLEQNLCTSNSLLAPPDLTPDLQIQPQVVPVHIKFGKCWLSASPSWFPQLVWRTSEDPIKS